MNTRNEWHIEGNAVEDIFYTREETIDSVKTNFDIRRFYSAEGVQIGIDGVNEQVIIQDHSNPINERKTDKKMLLPMDTTAQSGSYVNYRDNTWLIISHVNIVDDAYKSCQIQRCNYILKLQSEDGVVLSYPCIDETTNTIGINPDDIITTPNAVHKIKLPFDSHTVKLDTDMRFFIDDLSVKEPQVYAISKPNRTEFKFGDKGLIELTMKQDKYNSETDRIDLGICDYKELENPNTGDEVNINIVCANSSFNNKLKLGVTYSFTALITDEDGNPVVDVDPVFAIDTNYNGMVVITDNNSGNCTIKVNSSATSLISKPVILTCVDNVSGHSSSISLIIAALY